MLGSAPTTLNLTHRATFLLILLISITFVYRANRPTLTPATVGITNLLPQWIILFTLQTLPSQSRISVFQLIVQTIAWLAQVSTTPKHIIMDDILIVPLISCLPKPSEGKLFLASSFHQPRFSSADNLSSQLLSSQQPSFQIE